MPRLARILLYPIKSLDPVSVMEARIAPGGGLERDRALAIFDSDGKFVNGKRNPLVHGLRAAVNFDAGTIILCLENDDKRAVFHFREERREMESWLSRYLSQPVTVQENHAGGFPDDAHAPGPTLISSETLEEVSSWYAGLAVNEARIRFRANLEIAGDAPFWEDRLFAGADEVVRFTIGSVLFEGTNPCQRCIVPTRDSRTGEQQSDFAQIFRTRRQDTLPPWAHASRFNHFYRLAVNTRVPASECGKMLRVGDELRLEPFTG